MKTILKIILLIGFLFVIYDGLWLLVLLEDSPPTPWMVTVLQKLGYLFGNPWIGFLIAPVLLLIGLVFYPNEDEQTLTT